MVCRGRFPRPDELLDSNFQIETKRSYDSVDNSYNKSILTFPHFKNSNCGNKNCFMHLDYEFNTEKEVWETKTVRLIFIGGPTLDCVIWLLKLECNIWFRVQPHKTATLYILNHMRVVQSNMVRF